MGNKWTVLAFSLVILFSSLPLLNALPASLIFSHPSTVFVEETSLNRINYTALDENGSATFPLTPSGHNASCRYLFNPVDPVDPIGFNFSYNTSSQAHELLINYASAGNNSFTIQCTADGFDTMTIENTTQEVLPAPTSFDTSVVTNGSSAMLYVTYYTETFVALGIEGRVLTPEDNGQCNATIYENETDELVAELNLDYNGDSEAFQAEIELDAGTGYYWNVSCSAETNFESAGGFSLEDFYIDEESCEQVTVTSDLNVSESKTCSNDGGAPLYSIAADNVTINCNDVTFTGIGSNNGRISITSSGFSNVNIVNCNFDGFSAAFWITDSNNFSFANLSVSNSGNSINVINSNNINIDNFTFANGISADSPAIWISDGENNTISNGIISNYDLAIFVINANNTYINSVTFDAVRTGLTDLLSTSGTIIARNLVFNNSYLALFLTQTQSVLQNVSIYNSSFDPDLEATVVIASNNTIADIAIYNSSRDAVWLAGVNNSLALSASSVNGTALNLIEAINSSINLTSLVNNVLDINITDSTNSVYGNVFNGSFSSVFFNVTNSTQWQEIALFYNVSVPNTNNTGIYYNKLALYNDTGLLNITNLTSLFTLGNNSVSLNSSQIPFLNVSADITFTGVSYANNSVYEILRDGVVCNVPDCAVKISANPASFGVFGFSNYSTRPIPQNTTTTQATTTTAAAATGAGGNAAPAAQSAAEATTANATTQNTTTNQTVSEPRSNQAQQQNEQNTTAAPTVNETPTPPSPVTGLFAGLPKELNIYTAGAGVAVLALLGIGYFYFLRRH